MKSDTTLHAVAAASLERKCSVNNALAGKDRTGLEAAGVEEPAADAVVRRDKDHVAAADSAELSKRQNDLVVDRCTPCRGIGILAASY